MKLGFAHLTLVALLAVAPVWAQTFTGSISGSVTDSTGAAVGGARLKLISTATGAERTGAANELGDFVFGALNPGEYQILVEAAGFKTLERKNIMLTASERLAIGALVLTVGDLQEKVTVTAEGAVVQTASAERSASISSSQLNDLLVRGRNIGSLMSLLPGVVDTADGTAETPSANNASAFNVLGNRSNANNLSVDGLNITQPGGAPHAAFGISVDAIAEVKVLVSNYQAEYGRMSGADIQIVTKAGTRDFHGGASYFKRHEQFNAANFFNNRNGLAKARYRYNTWAYNVGGPVYLPGRFNSDRSKLFFFWSHEYWPQKSTSAINYSTTPSALERAGDFSRSVDVNGALVPIVDPVSRVPLAGNVVPASRVDRNGLALLKVFPLPNFLDTSISRRQYNHVTQWDVHNPFQLFSAKLDYNVNSRNMISATYTGSPEKTDGPNAGGITVPFAAFPGTQSKGWGHLVGARYQRIFSPTMVNEFTVGYVVRYTTVTEPPEALKNFQRATHGFAAGQFNAANNPLDLVPGMSFGGIVGAANISYDGRFPYDNARYMLDIGDNLTKTAGAHTLKAGFMFERIKQTDGPWANHFNGTFDFGRNANNPFDSGYAYANAALGVFNSYQEATSRPNPIIYSRGLQWFVQDNWKVSRRLTLDYGVRVYWFEPFWTQDNRMAGFVPGAFDRARQVQLIAPVLEAGRRVGRDPVTGRIYPAALIGFIAPGSGNPANGMVIPADTAGYPRALIDNPGMMPAPRIGFAYDPFGDGKTAIRGGFGLFYSRFLGYASSAVNSFPIVQTPLVQYDTIATFRSAQGFTSAPGVIAWEQNMRASSTMSVNLSVQRRIAFGTVLDVAYIGSLGRHLPWARSLQEIPIGARFDPKNADPTNTRTPLSDLFLRPRTGYNDITYREGAGSSNYHSLQVSASRRFARSLEFGANWTWSKAMDFVDGDAGAVTTLTSRRSWNYGLAGFDRTHAFKVNWLWDLPKARGGAAPLRAVVNGWQLSGIQTCTSGAPVGVGFSQVTAADLTGTPSIGSRIVVTGNPVLAKGERTFSRNFRTDVFRLPAVGTLGNAARTLLRGPGINNWDIALVKNFPIRERVKVQFRSEFYNAWNHTQFSGFDATARFDAAGNQVNARLGEFTAARNPRTIQFAMRVRF